MAQIAGGCNGQAPPEPIAGSDLEFRSRFDESGAEIFRGTAVRSNILSVRT